VIARRLRLLFIARFVRGDLRRWAWFLLASAGWRQIRRLAAREPELLYRARIGRGQVLAMTPSKPLPRKLRTRAVRRALEAAARGDLGNT
jgi:hypothetical protein